MNRIPLNWISWISMVVFLSSCDQVFTPKPKGYFRIDFPEKKYVRLDTIYPYTFEYPAYALITSDVHSPNEKNWINIEFPLFKGALYLSYKTVDGDLNLYTEDARTLVMKHIPKVSAIRDSLIDDPNRKLYGTLYQLQGKGVASPVQFYITDSIHNFLRASLYFNTKPQNDSMAPIIDFIERDIRHMIETFEWK